MMPESGDGVDQKAAAANNPSEIFMTEDQKIMVEPWNAIFGSAAIVKLFSKKFSDKEKGLQECEQVLKDASFAKNKETLRISALVVCKAIKDKLLAVNLKGISLLETTLAEHTDVNFEGSAHLV